MFRKLTPVLIVDTIESVLPLWDALGFRRTVEVPAGGRLGFVILRRDDVEVMYQTVASVEADEPRVLAGTRRIGAAAMFVEVTNLEEVRKLVPIDVDVVEERRETFYGATEMIFRDAAGNVITLAEMKADSAPPPLPE